MRLSATRGEQRIGVALSHSRRSFKVDVFVTASGILRHKIRDVTEAEVLGFESLVVGVQTAAAEMVLK